MSIYESSKCTSCMACYNACTRHCIKMNYNSSNSLEPCINENLCAHCDLCLRLCPENSPIEREKSLEAYACWNLDDSERASSSSGGIASIFYSHFIKNKLGTAYGCSYDEDLQLKFSKADTLEELTKFKTSKYTQSYVGDIFQEIRFDLRRDKFVVFVGTPCQVAGLKKFLRQDYEKLLTIDLICHGVGSQKYLDDYIKALNLPQKPNRLTFRGEYDFYFNLYRDDKIIFSEKSDDNLFYTAFLKGLFYRENCYTCPYASIERVR